MEFFIDPIPVQFPDLTGFRRHPESVDTFPVYYTYKTVPVEETVSVCSVLTKHLRRRLKYQDTQAGGILGMSDGVITHYYHDHYARCDGDHFLPSSDDLNWIMRQWRKVGISFAGIIKCQAADQRTPSSSDLRYVAALLSFNPLLSSVLMAIVADDLYFFRYDRDFLPVWLENMK